MKTNIAIVGFALAAVIVSGVGTAHAQASGSFYPTSVAELQQFLIAKGFLFVPPGTALGHFGPQTQSALARYQAAGGAVYYGSTPAYSYAPTYPTYPTYPSYPAYPAYPAYTYPSYSYGLSDCSSGSAYSAQTGERCDNNHSSHYSSNSSSDLEIRFDNNDPGNEDRTVSVDNQSITDNVPVLSWSLRSNDTDRILKRVEVDLRSLSGSDIGDMVRTLRLYADGRELQSESVDSNNDNSALVTFNNFSYRINQGDTADFEIKADIRGQSGNYSNNSRLRAAIDNNSIRAEDENGDDSNVSGSAEGGMITLRLR